MDALFIDVNWTAVVLGTIVAYLLGWLWYSPKLFGDKWSAGVGIKMDEESGLHTKAMVAQLIGTFLLAWVVGVTIATGTLALMALITLTIAVLIKTNGLYTRKSIYAIAIETTYIVAMVVIMVLTHALF